MIMYRNSIQLNLGLFAGRVEFCDRAERGGSGVGAQNRDGSRGQFVTQFAAFGRVGEDSAITGVAWAQTKGIEKVEVRLDHGQWQTAEPSTEVNADTWRMFDCGDG